MFIHIHCHSYLLFSPGSQSSQHIADCFFIAQAPSRRRGMPSVATLLSDLIALNSLKLNKI